MIPRNILFVCCLLCFLNFYQRHITVDAQNYYCTNNPYNPNTTTGGIYRTNLQLVLSNLSSNAALAANKGFYNFSAGSGPDTVYGLFLCRGDLTTDACAQCVKNAGDEIVKLCPDQKIAIIWLDECLLRYKNESMSSIVEQNIRIYMWNTQNATDPNKFTDVLGDMMDNITVQAANDNSGKKFAVQEANYTAFQGRIYALGQCTPDLSSDQCTSCLRNCIGDIPRCCNNRQGGRVLSASCNIRFEVYRFYNTVTPVPAPAPNVPSPPTPPSPPASVYPLWYYCPDNPYNPNSTTGRTYRTNLDFVLSYLSSNASWGNNNGFSSSFYPGSGGPSAVYGLFLCRGDVSTDVCAQCVANAGVEIVKRCPDQKIAIIWFDECLLRYKNESVISIVDQNNAFLMWKPQNATDPNMFNLELGSVMGKIAIRAAEGSGKKFDVQEKDYPPSRSRIYALGQCTPDLSSPSCESCLSKAISSIPIMQRSDSFNSYRGGRVLFASCNIRYELYRFYNSVYNPSPPEPSQNPYPPSPPLPRPPSSKVTTAIAIYVPVTVVSVVLFIMAFVFLKRRSRKRYDTIVLGSTGKAAEILTADSLQYRLSEIQNATNNFSVDNRIGKGGFGHVYKGVLISGHEIAVKRLSRSSVQGAEESVEEFKNEIMVVAKLQHRNLVRLLGFCLEGEEKILIFEFVPNKSLDYFLFDPEKQHYLNWSTRYNIIGGIAKGLLYLHEDSRLRIVHRDLKAGNILLDGNMNPKIADFGMAKICGVDQSEGNTNRIAGTIGYMAPEYARHGQFSVKSDVFSFGVLVLEIITGRKNSSFYHSNDSRDLISHVWMQWRSGTPLALLDPTIGDSYAKNEVIQSIHVSLLCVEEDVDRRPSMASVVYMLNSSSVTLPTPHHPAFFQRNRSQIISEEQEFDQSNTPLVPGSIAEASITEPYPR